MRPTIEIEKTHPEPLPSPSQAVRRNYPNFCWTVLVADREFFVRAGVWFYAADDRLNEDARSEVLPCTLLALAGCFFEQALEGGGFHVNVEPCPLGLINEADQLFEADGICEARDSPGEDVTEKPVLLAERPKNVNE